MKKLPRAQKKKHLKAAEISLGPGIVHFPSVIVENFVFQKALDRELMAIMTAVGEN